MEKMTYVKALNYVINGFTDDTPSDVVEKITALRDSQVKKAENKKATARQNENVGVKDTILAVLTTEGATVTDIQKRDETLGAMSNQRVSALLRQLIDEGKVVKTVDKKKSYFALVA